MSASSLRRHLAGVLAVALALLLCPEPACGQQQNETSRQALEEALRTSRRRLPGSIDTYANAVAGIIRQDPKRGPALIRDSLRLVKPGRWEQESAEYYLVEQPFREYVRVAPDAAANLALQHPARLFRYISPALQAVGERDPQAAVALARRMVKVRPRETPVALGGLLSQWTWGLTGAGSEPRRSAFTALVELLPRPQRAGHWLAAGLAGIRSDPEVGRPLLARALAESPGAQAELDWELFGDTSSFLPDMREGRYPKDAAGWKRLVEEARALGSEFGVAGIVRTVRHSNRGIARQVANMIRDPGAQALALSELLGERTAGTDAVAADAAGRIPLLLPRVGRPILTAYLAYRLGLWHAAADPEAAARAFRAGFDATLRANPRQVGLVEHRTTDWTLGDIQAILLSQLSRFRPAEALRLALPRRKSMRSAFPIILLSAAAHAPTSAQADAWLKAYMPRTPDAFTRRDFAVLSLDVHPERSIAVATGMKPGFDRDVLLVAIVTTLAAEQPSRAIALARHFKSDNARSAAYLEASRVALDAGPEARLRLARLVPQPLARADAMLEIVEQLLERTPPDVDRARQVAAEMPDEGPRWGAMAKIAERISAQDAEAGFRYGRAIQRYTERLEAEKYALGKLIPARVERALELAREETSPEGQVDLLAAVGDNMAGHDPEAAVRLAQTFQHRPTREQILAAAMSVLLEKAGDAGRRRALELAPEIVTRQAGSRVLPRLWWAAVEAGDPPSAVAPLYRWLSHDAYNAGWGWGIEELRTDREEADRYGWRPHRKMAIKTRDWLSAFPMETWLAAFRPHLTGPADARLQDSFVQELVIQLAAAPAPHGPEAADAMLQQSSLDAAGILQVLPALAEVDLPRAEANARRIRQPRHQVDAWLILTRVAAKRKVASDLYRREALRAAAAWSREIEALKRPEDRAAYYLGLASQSKSAGVDPVRFIGQAREEIALVRSPLQRAELLARLEALARKRP